MDNNEQRNVPSGLRPQATTYAQLLESYAQQSHQLAKAELDAGARLVMVKQQSF